MYRLVIGHKLQFSAYVSWLIKLEWNPKHKRNVISQILPPDFQNAV
jgi:hypothetical protein